MENLLTVDGLTFEPYITNDQIQEQVRRVASEIRMDLKGPRSAVYLRAEWRVYVCRRLVPRDRH